MDAPQVANALLSAGIPRRYQHKDKGLRNYGLSIAVQLADWVEGDAKVEIKSGKGRFFVGSTVRALDLFFYTARNLVIHNRMMVQVVSIPLLGKILWTEQFRDQVEDIDVLCVQGFYDAHYKNPLSEEMLSSLDWFFRNRLLNERAILFHATDVINACVWWSPTLLQLVSNSVGTPLMVDQDDIRARKRAS